MGTKLKPGLYNCHARALPDEPLFTVLARDPYGPTLARDWANDREVRIRVGAAPDSDRAMVAEARECAANMEAWRTANNGKWRNSAPPFPPYPPQFGVLNDGRKRDLYVCGLLFATTQNVVLLIEKNRPAWMAGKLNGIGGKLEPGESPLQAMDREADEEAGLRDIPWALACTLTAEDFHVWFFSAFDDRVYDAKAATDEHLYHLPPRSVSPLSLMPNLPAVIALALDSSGIVKPVQLFDGVPNNIKTTAP